MVEIGGVKELDKEISKPFVSNSANDMITRSSGVMIEKTANVTGTGSQSVNILQFTGSVLILNQWAEITEITTLSNLTNSYADVWDGTNSLNLTADGITLSGAPVGTFFTKDQIASQAYSVNIADEVRMLETLGDRFAGRPFIITAKNGVDNFVRLHYTTTDNPVNFSIRIVFEYLTLNGGTLAFL